MAHYDLDFYKDRHGSTLYAAKTILQLALDQLTRVDSIVDVGCGVGTWLNACREKGIEDTLGLDGPWVPKDLLVIPEEHFLDLDFNAGLVPKIERRYGLAICLEVAEHIEPDKAGQFVDFLAALSDRKRTV